MIDVFDYLPADMGSPCIERKPHQLRWNDGTLTCAYEFEASLDNWSLSTELKAIWRMWSPCLGRKAEMIYGRHGGFYSAPKEALCMTEEVVRFYFDAALRRLLTLNPKGRKPWHQMEETSLRAKRLMALEQKKLIPTRPLLLGATTHIRAMNIGSGYVVAWTGRDGFIHQELFKTPDRRMFKRMLNGGWSNKGLSHPRLGAMVARYVAMHPPVNP